MAPPRVFDESAIEKASLAMDENPELKGSVAARRFEAPYARLMARRRGRPPSSSRGGLNKKLTEPANDALLDYIETMAYAGTPLNLETVTQAANRLLQWSTGGEARVAKRWAKRWFVRNKEFVKTIKSKTMAVKRRAAFRPVR